MSKSDKKMVEKDARKAVPKRSKKKPATAGADASAAAEVRSAVLERLYAVVESRKGADPATSHSARLMSRGTAKVAQKLGEEAVECVIEAVTGNREALIAESADVLYHLIVVWVSAGIAPDDVWAELQRREGVSGIEEKASRPSQLARRAQAGTSKIP